MLATMKLVVLGTAGYHPNEQRQTTCLMLPEAGILFDAGTAVFRVPRYLATETLDIFLSHAHLDHTIGLTYLLDVMAVTSLTRVRVHAEPSKLDAIREHLFAPDLFPVAPPFEEVPLGNVWEWSGLQVTHHSLKHPGGSVGYRVDSPNKSLAFITDTTAAPDADYRAFVHGVDLLIHECNFRDDEGALAEKTGHSCLGQVLTLARDAKVGQLLLMHFNPLCSGVDVAELEYAKSTFREVLVAEDHMELEI